MESREDTSLEPSDSELSTAFPERGPAVVKALVYKRGEKRRPEYLLVHSPYSQPLRRFLRLLTVLITGEEGDERYDKVVTTMTCLVNKMERQEVSNVHQICNDPGKLKDLFLAIPTDTEWDDGFPEAFALISAELADKCKQCLDYWSSHPHSSPMYWDMPSGAASGGGKGGSSPPTREEQISEAVPLACQIVLAQAGFRVRPHPIIKPVTYVNEDSNIRTTVCLCQIMGEDKTFDKEGATTHRMFFPLGGAMQHLRDPYHLETPNHLKYFHKQLYDLDQALIDKRQAARRSSEDNFICSPSPLSEDGRKRRISSSSETSDGRSPKSPCTKSPLYRRTLALRPPPSFAGGVKPITEMPSLSKDPRLKG